MSTTLSTHTRRTRDGHPGDDGEPRGVERHREGRLRVADDVPAEVAEQRQRGHQQQEPQQPATGPDHAAAGQDRAGQGEPEGAAQTAGTAVPDAAPAGTSSRLASGGHARSPCTSDGARLLGRGVTLTRRAAPARASRLLGQRRGRQRAERRERVEVRRDVASSCPATAAGPPCAGWSAPGPGRTRRPRPRTAASSTSPCEHHVHSPDTSAIGGRPSSRRGEPAGHPVADDPQAVAVTAADDADRAAQVLLVDHHVVERAAAVLPHPGHQGVGGDRATPRGGPRPTGPAGPRPVAGSTRCCGRRARPRRARRRPARPCARAGHARSSPGTPAPSPRARRRRAAPRARTRARRRPARPAPGSSSGPLDRAAVSSCGRP